MARPKVLGGAVTPLLALVLACLSTAPPLCGAHGDDSHINICASDERPMSGAAKRLSCKEDPKCIHETQCGCIPKGCTCGNDRCIFAAHAADYSAEGTASASGSKHDEDEGEEHTHDEGKGHMHIGGDMPHHHAADGSMIPDGEATAVAVTGTSASALGSISGASKHHLVDDDSEGPAHTHTDGTTHGHPGGDMPHHHDKGGGIVFDLPANKPVKLAKRVMNKGKMSETHAHTHTKAKDDDDAVDADSVHKEPAKVNAAPTETVQNDWEKSQSAEAGRSQKLQSAAAESGGGAASGDGGSKASTENINGTSTHDSPAAKGVHKKMVGILVMVLGLGILALMIAAFCTCCGSAVVRCFKHKVLGKSMLSRDMFNDNEMTHMDWDSKSNAAGWRHDDGL